MKFKNLYTTLLLIIFLYSFYMVLNNLFILPERNRTESESIKDIYYTDYENNNPNEKTLKKDENNNTKNNVTTDNTENKFNKLKEINNDIIGWINIPNTVIDYPVLISDISSPEYYLKRDYKKNTTKYGSIFMDSRCYNISESKNITLYGHNMNDGQMFAALLNYGDLSFYKESPVINFDIMGKKEKWKIISVYKINVQNYENMDFNYTENKFKSDDDFLKFAENIKKRSIINIPVDVEKEDVILTLSTCSYEKEDNRTVISARKLRKNESETVDIENAYYN